MKKEKDRGQAMYQYFEMTNLCPRRIISGIATWVTESKKKKKKTWDEEGQGCAAYKGAIIVTMDSNRISRGGQGTM